VAITIKEMAAYAKDTLDALLQEKSEKVYMDAVVQGFGAAQVKYEYGWADPRGLNGLNRDPQSSLAVEGVLFFRGAPVGDDWRGAHMGAMELARNGSGQRVVKLRSKYERTAVELTMPAKTSDDTMMQLGQQAMDWLNKRRELPWPQKQKQG